MAITDDGSLCMDGTLYSNPTVDLANVNLLNWKNTQTGYLLQVDSAASTGSTLSLRVHTLNGDVIGNLVGGKTQLLAKCAGPVDGNINIDAANQLFTLAEQRQPATFPLSALTYNQLSGGSLKRYYPAISLLLTVTGENVQVSGGVYGRTPSSLGKVADLVKQLSPTVLSTAALAVSGNMTFKQGNLPAIARSISINETVAMPLSTAYADLTRMEFTVRIANSTTIAGAAIARSYDLRFIFSRN